MPNLPITYCLVVIVIVDILLRRRRRYFMGRSLLPSQGLSPGADGFQQLFLLFLIRGFFRAPHQKSKHDHEGKKAACS